MALFRDNVGVETVKNSCPICHSDVKGNDIYLYFCQKCNILFKREELMLTKEAINGLLKEKIAEKFTRDAGKIKIEEPKLKQKEMPDSKKELLEKHKAIKRYFASRKSNVVHVSNCPYGKNIKRENRIILKSLDDAKGYRRCRCLSD